MSLLTVSTKAEAQDTKMLSTMEAASNKEEQPTLLIDEQIDFTQSLITLLETHLPEIARLMTQTLALKGVNEPQTFYNYEEAVGCVAQVKALLDHMGASVDFYCQSMAKFAYLT